MCKLRFTNKAVEDLSDIWNYTFDTWSEKQADVYYAMLTKMCHTIAESPLMGKTYEEVADGLYGMIAGKHIIFYRRVSDDTVEIIRILHGSMDLKSRIGE